MSLRKGFSFFGKSDSVHDPNMRAYYIGASFPSWYFTQKINDLKEQIYVEEERLKVAIDPVDGHPQTARVLKENIARNKRLLAGAMKDRPKLSPQEKTYLQEFYSQGCKRITEESVTKSDDMMGRINPHDEYRKQTFPYIPVDRFADIFAACNIKPRDGKVSLKNFIIAWKIVGRAINENTNTMFLQKPDKNGQPLAPAEHSKDFIEYCKEYGV